MRSFLWLGLVPNLSGLALASPVELREVEKFFTVQQTVWKPQLSGPAALFSAYKKYDKQAPDYVVEAATSNNATVTTTPQRNDATYLTPVTVGGQLLNLNFDTGSADLWVFSSELAASDSAGHSIYDPSKSATSQRKDGYSWQIKYGDGSRASGDVYSDIVQVGGITATRQAVEAAQTISAQFQQDVNGDGLLGLGFSSNNRVSPQKQLNFFDNVKSSFSQPVFTADLKKGAPGSYTFGIIDPTQYTGSITYAAVSPSRGFWQITSNGYAIGTGSFQSSSINAVMDTGTSLLLLPNTIVAAYYAQVPSASLNRRLGGYTFDCGAPLRSFAVGIGSYQAIVPGSFIEYAPVDEDGETCFGGIQPDTDIGFSILGDVFLKSQFVVFDGSPAPRVGFAPKPL